VPLAYDSWLQHLCPSPRRYLQQLVARLGLRTGVDLGCGENSLLAPLRQQGSWYVGVDASPGRLRKAERRGLFDEYVCAEVVDWLRSEARGGRRWGVVVASHLIEHLDRDTGAELLALAETVATRLVYVETPHGFVEPGFEDDALSGHRSGWFPWDFEARGYAVFGMGVRWLRGPRGRARCGQEFLTRSAERAFQWLSYRCPRIAATLAAIRHTDETGMVRRL
jgi:hypothetical protein